MKKKDLYFKLALISGVCWRPLIQDLVKTTNKSHTPSPMSKHG